MLFKVDTSADVTAISDIAWELVCEQVGKLERSKQQLCGPDHQPLTVIGIVTLTLSINEYSCKQNVFIVKGLKNNLLGLPTIRQLKHLMEVNTVQKSIPDKYSELFTGLGSIKELHKIKMNPDAKPYALFTPRHVPLPLKAKVHKSRAQKNGNSGRHLQSRDNNTLVSRIDSHTRGDWCCLHLC